MILVQGRSRVSALNQTTWSAEERYGCPVFAESTTTITCELPGTGTRVGGCGSKNCKQTAHKKEVQPEAPVTSV